MANPRKQSAKDRNDMDTSSAGLGAASRNASTESTDPFGSGGSTPVKADTGRSESMVSAGSSGGGAAGTATARSLYDQAKETAGQAYEAAAEKATTKLEEQKSNLSGGLAAVADSVRRVSENLRGPDVQNGIASFTSEYSESAARKIENVANYFERKSVREMYADLENFARRNPAMFVGGAFAIGLMAARFLKSGSTQSKSSGNRSEREQTAGRTSDRAQGRPTASPA